VRSEGVVRRAPGRTLELGEAGTLRPGSIMQNLTLDQFGQASGLRMKPFVLEQTTDTQDGLVRDWPKPSSGMDKHFGYAFQWYALAATAFLFFLITGFRRGRKD
jgi:cytochrome oxidase assembly protein ShyY1